MSLLTRAELKRLRIQFRDIQGQHDNWSDFVARAQNAVTLKAAAEWLVLVREEIDREHPSMDSPARYGLFVARITDALPLLSEGKMPGEE